MTLTTHSQYALVSVADAQQIVEKQAVVLTSEEVGLQEALGRVLAQNVLASDDLPPFPASIKVVTSIHHLWFAVPAFVVKWLFTMVLTTPRTAEQNMCRTDTQCCHLMEQAVSLLLGLSGAVSYTHLTLPTNREV